MRPARLLAVLTCALFTVLLAPGSLAQVGVEVPVYRSKTSKNGAVRYQALKGNIPFQLVVRLYALDGGALVQHVDGDAQPWQETFNVSVAEKDSLVPGEAATLTEGTVISVDKLDGTLTLVLGEQTALPSGINQQAAFFTTQVLGFGKGSKLSDFAESPALPLGQVVAQPGLNNVAVGDYDTVGGGAFNTADGLYVTIGGGQGNVASNLRSTIAGGVGNRTGTYGAYVAIGGGRSNTGETQGVTIGGGGFNVGDGTYATIGGGIINTTDGRRATVAGGYSNKAMADDATVGGGSYNSATADGSTIAGGEFNDSSNTRSTVGGGLSNSASGSHATVAGGRYNLASSTESTVGGGFSNTASGSRGTVSGGRYNLASASESTVGGGRENTASFPSAIVSGGLRNTAAAQTSTVGGGYQNSTTGYAAAIAGGRLNDATGVVTFIGGGRGNTSSGSYSVVGGGFYNTAAGNYSSVIGGAFSASLAAYSFAGGRQARADHTGAFVWGDSQPGVKHSLQADSFTVYARGGSRFFSDADGSVGVGLAPGSGSWSALSDRDAKEAVEPVDPREVLQRVLALPISTWRYRTQEDGVRHMGPMAQDFHAAFGLGVSEKLIDAVDPDGVALAAIQGLHQELAEKDDQLTRQQQELDALRAELQALRELVEAATAR